MYENEVFGIAPYYAGLIAYFAVLGITMIVSIVCYILNSISLYTIAKRRQISNPWLAWLPIGDYWTIGSIVDDYEKRNGLKRNWRVVLIILSLISFAAVIVFYVIMMISIISFALASGNTEPEAEEMLGLFVAMYVGIIVIIIPATALQSCGLICTYKIYESTVPEKSLKYFLLSLLVPFAGVICLFKCRNQGYSNEPVEYNYTSQQTPTYPPQNGQ